MIPYTGYKLIIIIISIIVATKDMETPNIYDMDNSQKVLHKSKVNRLWNHIGLLALVSQEDTSS
jgi:hypothetical protein